MNKHRGKRVLIIGGYGHFGKKLCQLMAELYKPSEGYKLTLIIAGRDQQKAEQFSQQLKQQFPLCCFQGVCLNYQDQDLSTRIKDLRIDLVIHTSGPFQQQTYHVAIACAKANIHYIDLADGREFVAQFQTLDTMAKQQHVALISGASSVPGLSSAVICHFQKEFRHIKAVSYGITPGNQGEIGMATVSAILSQLGQPMTRWHNGKWQTVFGWENTRKHRFLSQHRFMKNRLFGNCDIPDNGLFPTHFPTIECFDFKAGVELKILHYGLLMMAKVAKWGWIRNWQPYAKIAWRMNQLLSHLGSDCGGMYMQLIGINPQGVNQTITWELIATNNSGPNIPIIAGAILAKKLIADPRPFIGASACINHVTLEEFSHVFTKWNIQQTVNKEINRPT